MDAPDFAAILAPRLPEWTGDSRLRWMNMAEQALAARIPEACPDCHGTGTVVEPTFAEQPLCLCGHPNAPTIGTALAEWWAAREGQT